MKHLYASLFSFIVISTAYASELLLTIDGFQSDNGHARVALVNSQETFEVHKSGPNPYKSTSLTMVNGKGERFLSIPVESYGFSK